MMQFKKHVLLKSINKSRFCMQLSWVAPFDGAVPVDIPPRYGWWIWVRKQKENSGKIVSS